LLLSARSYAVHARMPIDTETSAAEIARLLGWSFEVIRMKSPKLKSGILAFALIAAGAALAQQTEHGGKPITVKMTGANEVPGPGATSGTGTATLRFNPGQQQLCYELKVSGIGAANGAHIHAGAAGKSGDVKVPLNTPGADGTSKGCASVDPAVLKDIMSNPGNYYVNVHTAEFPNGALRGQLTK